MTVWTLSLQRVLSLARRSTPQLHSAPFVAVCPARQAVQPDLHSLLWYVNQQTGISCLPKPLGILVPKCARRQAIAAFSSCSREANFCTLMVTLQWQLHYSCKTCFIVGYSCSLVMHAQSQQVQGSAVPCRCTLCSSLLPGLTQHSTSMHAEGYFDVRIPVTPTTSGARDMWQSTATLVWRPWPLHWQLQEVVLDANTEQDCFVLWDRQQLYRPCERQRCL